MINAYSRTSQGLRKLSGDIANGISPDILWIDMIQPSLAEEHEVESQLGIDIPTREEAQEIEVSSRLYTEGAASYMTATLVVNAEGDHPHTTPVTFILTSGHLITVRYDEPRPFKTFPITAERHAEFCVSSTDVLLGLLDAVIDRTADVLERIQADVDKVSQELFLAPNGLSPNAGRRPNESGTHYRGVLRREGRNQLLTLKIHESLVSIGRIVTFLSRPGDTKPLKSVAQRLKSLSRDVSSLGEHASHLAQTLAFLQDATLGLINIEQNEIIKIFSIAAVVFLPPTLIASLYGMNFEYMPELHWPIAYPLALALMGLAGFLPYWYFKRKGWF